MTDNPLVVSGRPARSTWDLDAYCDDLNNLHWVRGSGFRYFVAERVKPNGQVERFLDRSDMPKAPDTQSRFASNRSDA